MELARADAGGTPGGARTASDQSLSFADQLGGALVDPFRQADAPRVRVEEKHRGIEAAGSPAVRVASRAEILALVGAVAERLTEVPRVAHQGERCHRFERLRHAAEAV